MQRNMAKPEDISFGYLLNDVTLLFRKHFDRRAVKFGLTRAQWRATKMVYHREGMRQTELAEFLEMEPIAVGRVIDRLQAAGFVERRPDPKDRRAWRLYPTEQARGIIGDMEEIGRELRKDATRGIELRRTGAGAGRDQADQGQPAGTRAAGGGTALIFSAPVPASAIGRGSSRARSRHSGLIRPGIVSTRPPWPALHANDARPRQRGSPAVSCPVARFWRDHRESRTDVLEKTRSARGRIAGHRRVPAAACDATITTSR